MNMANNGFRRGITLFNMKFGTSSQSKNFSTGLKALGGYNPHGGEIIKQPHKVHIGKREVVGYGNCGEENYIDHVHYPFPAIRFREDDAAVAKLREKEKGDWKKMTVEEKKALYRASFCQTFAENTAPTGEWKAIVGKVAALFGCAMLVYLYYRKFGEFKLFSWLQFG